MTRTIARATEIINGVTAALATWRAVGARLGLTETELEALSQVSE